MAQELKNKKHRTTTCCSSSTQSAAGHAAAAAPASVSTQLRKGSPHTPHHLVSVRNCTVSGSTGLTSTAAASLTSVCLDGWLWRTRRRLLLLLLNRLWGRERQAGRTQNDYRRDNNTDKAAPPPPPPPQARTPPSVANTLADWHSALPSMASDCRIKHKCWGAPGDQSCNR